LSSRLSAAALRRQAVPLASGAMRTDTDVAAMAIAHHGNALADLAPSLRAHRPTVLLAVARSGDALK